MDDLVREKDMIVNVLREEMNKESGELYCFNKETKTLSGQIAVINTAEKS